MLMHAFISTKCIVAAPVFATNLVTHVLGISALHSLVDLTRRGRPSGVARPINAQLSLLSP